MKKISIIFYICSICIPLAFSQSGDHINGGHFLKTVEYSTFRKFRYYMKFWKLVMCSTFMFCTFFACEQKTNVLMLLRYDKEKNMLLIDHAESARILKKIELDLQQDTLVISKIVKKLVPWNGEKSVRKTVNCVVKVPSNVEFVKLGDMLYKLSEIDKFSYEEITERYNWGVIIVYPKKFPFVID